MYQRETSQTTLALQQVKKRCSQVSILSQKEHLGVIFPHIFSG
jgi:hypothetical protein